MASNALIPLVVVLGPSGSGKSELAVFLAKAIDGEVVNCDSLQLYRGFDIGTAKLAEAERRGVPHHLIDVLHPTELFTAGEYARRARNILMEISGRGRVPMIVGGTGFYLRALLEGLFPGPSRDSTVRERLELRERKKPGSLHRILARLDPATATRIHRNDKKKIIRALEVRLLEGRPISTLYAQGRAALSGFTPVKLGLNPNRALLYQRLDARTRGIFERGLIEEVAGLLAAGVPATAKPFESLGYKQALQVIAGRWTAEQALQSTQSETRQYAKRQLTWFRKEPAVHWLEGFGDEARIQQEALAMVGRHITEQKITGLVTDL